MKNKQKQWRRSAGPAKEQFIAQGLHVKGRRYGRIIKATMNGPKINAVPRWVSVLAVRAHASLILLINRNQQVLPA